MRNVDELVHLLDQMGYNAIHNYVVPGLTSRLLGRGEHGAVRMFDSSRDTEEFIHPHTHRFDFACIVLRGEVVNTIYDIAETRNGHYDSRDVFTRSKVTGRLGAYECEVQERDVVYWRRATKYTEGDIYAMRHDEFHSIKFSGDAKVLFFEGPPTSDFSFVLEPSVSGVTVPTFSAKPWMFIGDGELIPEGGKR